ncbi:ribosome rescue protein RqcH [Haloarcula nitratireducens]|uniref:Archaeal Rqc2 homolog aRqcH n=1 Tax=Haloarcula nitratireducens TaxID=2487749 RepID=A0AAW4P958_9EURY|nr:ribosome rescue protein RqcH [Halomicroarcula nitratireducens]MBX0294338.1 NFACT family protein [Halomicroarcula nitratireducens]
MDEKRELTSADLAALESELSDYIGAKLDKAYLYDDDDVVRLKMRDFDRGRVEFIIELGDVKRAHVAATEHVPDAPGRPPDFAMMLRNRLSGADLARVEQFEFDRILELEFDREDASTTIVAELFGDGNVAVLDEHGEVIDCLDTVRLKSRTVAPGTPYEFPSARFNPLTVDYEGFAARIRESDADVVRTLATQLNFGGLYGEELCSRADIEYNLPVEDLTDEQLERLYEVVSELATQLREGDLDPRVYYESTEDGDSGDADAGDGEANRRRVDVTPIPLVEYDHLYSERFESFNDALDDYFFNFQREEQVEGGEPQRPDFEAEVSKYEHIIQQQEEAIEDFEADAEAEREKAELLYANYDLVDEVLSTVQGARAEDVPWAEIEATFEEGAEQGIPAAEAVVGVDGTEGTVTLDIDGTRVTVDAHTGVEKNADELYKEAKRIEGKKEGALAAIEDTREDLEAVQERREQWEAEDTETEAESDDEDEDDEPTDWLNEPSIPVRSTEQWYEQFRWFHTSDGYLVIGGRDADDNEELVQKYLERGDKFFHAQAHGGPVTVLKATGPSEPAKEVEFPQSSLDEAAQFAVSYSSVWKDGRFAGDVYMVDPDQVSKTPESGEYLEKGGFAVRGDRTYFEDTEASVAVGITCEDETRVVGGPPAAIRPQAATSITVEPGQYAQNDIAKMLYREFKSRFADETFVRKVASPDRIQEFLPPGGSRMVEE